MTNWNCLFSPLLNGSLFHTYVEKAMVMVIAYWSYLQIAPFVSLITIRICHFHHEYILPSVWKRGTLELRPQKWPIGIPSHVIWFHLICQLYRQVHGVSSILSIDLASEMLCLFVLNANTTKKWPVSLVDESTYHALPSNQSLRDSCLYFLIRHCNSHGIAINSQAKCVCTKRFAWINMLQFLCNRSRIKIHFKVQV